MVRGPFALAGALAALVACGTPTTGSPVPAAGFTPDGSDLTAVDLCRVLTADDLAAAGGLAAEPQPRTTSFPDSCGYPLGGGATGDLALVALYKPVTQIRRDQPGGHEETAGGYPTWVHCTVADGYRTCTAAVAVRPDRSVVVAIDKRDVSEKTLLRLLQPLTELVIHRLPRA